MSGLSVALLDWYEKNRRHLPWREDPKPYYVFLSEIMLQQTRVDTVVPYFEHFIASYPDIVSLAKANEEEVYLLWQGLGYYSRARNLLKAAKAVVENYGGELPKEKEKLLSLPGIGPYVSSAISAIAFEEKEVAVDGNLLRVYSRLNADKIDVSSAKSKQKCEIYYKKHLESPSRFNQALMDLGELVCLPHGAPLCDKCPLASFCKAKRLGHPEDYPLAKRKSVVRKVDLHVLLAFDSRGNIAVRTRPDDGLLASLYEFPNAEGHPSICELGIAYPTLAEFRYLGQAKHRFSHIEWNMRVYEAKGILPGYEYVPVTELKKRYSLPTAFAKLLDLFS